MANLFKNAKKATPKKATKKDKIDVVVNPSLGFSNQEVLDFHTKVTRFKKLSIEIDPLVAEFETIKGEIKQIGKEQFINVFKENGVRPTSFTLSSSQGESIMIVSQDKYSNLSEESATEMKENFGDDTVEEATTYKFNNKMLEKYMDVLSDLIENSDKIADDDKAKLIEATTVYSVKKGLIDKLDNYGEKMEDLFETINPVFQVKNV